MLPLGKMSGLHVNRVTRVIEPAGSFASSRAAAGEDRFHGSLRLIYTPIA
jgi:hypothetical protein